LLSEIERIVEWRHAQNKSLSQNPALVLPHDQVIGGFGQALNEEILIGSFVKIICWFSQFKSRSLLPSASMFTKIHQGATAPPGRRRNHGDMKFASPGSSIYVSMARNENLGETTIYQVGRVAVSGG